GAVDSQAAEAYLLREGGNDELLSPAREREYNLLLPPGGVELRAVGFSRPILSADAPRSRPALSADLRRLLPRVVAHSFPRPFDIGLGFGGGAPRLLQVRPFVQNRRAWSSPYLRALDEGVPRQTPVSLDQEMPNP